MINAKMEMPKTWRNSDHAPGVIYKFTSRILQAEFSWAW